MGSCSAPVEPINQFALVTYLPDELGHYLDQLRRDLVTQCTARSHLSLLPPRPISVTSAAAENQILNVSRIAQPFVVKIGNVAIFPQTSVIYLELLSGQRQIADLHDQLSTGAFEFNEPYPFHPHITLAQNFGIETVKERYEQAVAAWEAYTGPREFLLDNVVFVQNSVTNCWADLRQFSLLGLPGGPAPEAQMAHHFTQTY